MAIDQVDRTVVTETPRIPGDEQQGASQPTIQTVSRHRTRTGPEGSELARRITILLFGLIQIVIGARLILVVLDAREANGIVSAILNVSQIFVAPFNGILNTNALTSGGSILDVAAILAFAGWSVLELITLWATGIFRREPA